jgi:hypothetical protein
MFGVLACQLSQPLFELFLVLRFAECQLSELMALGYIVQGIDDGVAELVQFIDDLAQRSLVAEILFRGQHDESFDEGRMLALGVQLGLDVAQRLLEHLNVVFHLRERWVLEVG